MEKKMKAVMGIDFEEVNGTKITDELISQHPEIVESAKKLMDKFCVETEKYFKQHKIKSKISYAVK